MNFVLFGILWSSILCVLFRVIAYVFRLPERKPPRKWKTEEICRRIFERHFNGAKFPSIWHPDIVNPRTGKQLQLDGYNGRLGVAFEYNGEQHYHYPNNYHTIEQEFINQQWRDRVKAERCAQLGIKLIVIPYTVDHKDLEQHIKIKLLDHK